MRALAIIVLVGMAAAADAAPWSIELPDGYTEYPGGADDQVALHRLDVDVAGALLRGAEEQAVDEADDRRFVAGVEEVGGLFEVVLDRVEVLGLHLVDSLVAQLRGSVSLDTTHGTRFTIRFVRRDSAKTAVR